MKLKYLLILFSAVIVLISLCLTANAVVFDGVNMGSSNFVPGHVLQVPSLAVSQNPENTNYVISVQNVGQVDTTFILALFDEEQYCAPQADGLLKVECSQNAVPPGAVYHWDSKQFDSPADYAVSGLIFAFESGPDSVDICQNVAGCMMEDSEEKKWRCVWDLFVAYNGQTTWNGPVSTVSFAENVDDAWIVSTVTLNVDGSHLSEYNAVSESNEGRIAVAGPLDETSKVYVQSSDANCLSLETWLCDEDGSCFAGPTVLNLATGARAVIGSAEYPIPSGGPYFMLIESSGDISAVVYDQSMMYNGVDPTGQTQYILAPLVGCQNLYAASVEDYDAKSSDSIYVHNLENTDALVEAVYYDYNGKIIEKWVTMISGNGYKKFDICGPRGYMTFTAQNGNKLTGTYRSSECNAGYTLMTYDFNSLDLYETITAPWFNGVFGGQDYMSTVYTTNFLKTPGDLKIGYGFSNQNGLKWEISETLNEKDQDIFFTAWPFESDNGDGLVGWDIASGKYLSLTGVVEDYTVPEIAMRGIVKRNFGPPISLSRMATIPWKTMTFGYSLDTSIGASQ